MNKDREKRSRWYLGSNKQRDGFLKSFSDLNRRPRSWHLISGLVWITRECQEGDKSPLVYYGTVYSVLVKSFCYAIL